MKKFIRANLTSVVDTGKEKRNSPTHCTVKAPWTYTVDSAESHLQTKKDRCPRTHGRCAPALQKNVIATALTQHDNDFV